MNIQNHQPTNESSSINSHQILDTNLEKNFTIFPSRYPHNFSIQHKKALKERLPDLFDLYKHPYPMLSALYPDYTWLPWKFIQSPKNYWSDISNQRMFLDWAGKQLGLNELNNWYGVHVKVTVCVGRD
jgi:hypothetical protein